MSVLSATMAVMRCHDYGDDAGGNVVAHDATVTRLHRHRGVGRVPFLGCMLLSKQGVVAFLGLHFVAGSREVVAARLSPRFAAMPCSLAPELGAALSSTRRSVV